MKKITTPLAPKAIWPYSQAIQMWNMLFCSWQVWLIPETMTIIEWWIEAETKQVISNIKAVLTEAWYEIKDVVKITIFLQNMSDFALVNEIYWKTFDHCPARSTVEVAKLPKWALVEIEVLAIKN